VLISRGAMFSKAYASENTKSLYQTTDDLVDDPLTPVFRVKPVSHSLLTTLQANGRAPDRKTFDLNLAKAGAEGFRLKLGTLSDIEQKAKIKEERRRVREQFVTKKDTKDTLLEDASPAADATRVGGGNSTAGSAAGARLDTGLSASSSAPALGAAGTPLEKSRGATQEKKMSRADKYYHALLKAEWQRNERLRKEQEAETIAKAEAAATAAFKTATAAEKEEGNSSKSDDSEAEEKDEDEEEVEVGPLVAYDGALRLEVEIVVLRAPGVGKSDDHSDSGRESTATPASSGSGSDLSSERGMDLSKELQALQEELEKPEEEEVKSEESDGLPDGLRLRKIPDNINDANDKRVALGLGGTAFFVPDVERYALAPSLLPPPPQSLAGRRRLRLKPRLPLEISRHRWRDEHPHIGAPPAYSPDVDEKKSYEDKMCMVDLYHGVHSVMTQLPKPDGIRRPPPEKLFDLMLDSQLKNSRAWKQHIKRERCMVIAVNQAREAEEQRRLEAEKAMEGGLGKPAGEPVPYSAPPGAGTPATDGNRRRGSNPPSPPEAGGGGSGAGLMGVAPGIRAGA